MEVESEPMRTTEQTNERNRLLKALEDRRRKLELEHVKLSNHEVSLSMRDRQRLNELRERMDEINTWIVVAIVEEDR